MDETELKRAVATVLMPGFDGPDLPDWLAAELAGGLGSVCLFSSNVASDDQLRRLTAAIHAAAPAALIAMDEEGGDVTRLHHRGGSAAPSPAYLGRLDDLDVTRRVAEHLGAELRAAGVDLNLAPIADVNSNPDNPVIGVRSYGSRPQPVAEQVSATVAGVQAAAVAACVKHFPGHGDTATDSHLALPRIDADLDQLAARELVPFRAAVQAGVLAVMTSHILVPALDPDLPATLSPAAVRLLRDELGFAGVLVSDALDMAGASAGRGIPEAAVLALLAGVDLLCIGSGNTAGQLAGISEHIAAAVRQGRLPEQRLAEAAGRVRALAAELARQRATAPPPPVGTPVPLTPAAFWVRPGLAIPASALFLRLDTPANIAAGDTVWGIGEHLADEVARALPGSSFARASSIEELERVLAAQPQLPVIAQGRDLSRLPFLKQAASLLRRRSAATILVEEGWPALGRDPRPDIATYGSSRGTMTALIELLARGQR